LWRELKLYLKRGWLSGMEMDLYKSRISDGVLMGSGTNTKRAQEIKWKNTELTTSWNNIKIYLMLCAKQTWLCFVQRVFSKAQLMCGSCPLLAWEFRLAEMGRILIVLSKSWKRLKSWKKIEILKSWEPTWEPIPESWNKIEIMKQDWNPETRSVQEKQKILHLCSTITSLRALARPPFFCAENSDNNWSCRLPPR
jgi:hypothetical protein